MADAKPPGPPLTLLSGPLSRLADADPPTLSPQAPVLDAARLLATRRSGFVVVVDADRRPSGVLTESRLLAALRGPRPAVDRVEALAQAPLCVSPELDAGEACRRSLAEGGQPLLLLDAEGRLAGAVGEGAFRTHLQLAALAGRHSVAAVMTRVTRPLARADSVAHAVAQMHSGADTAVVVAEGDRPVGVLTTRDVARLAAAGIELQATRLDEVMSRPVLTLPPEASVHDAAERMLAARTRHLVVVDAAQRVVGVLDEHELTRSLAFDLAAAGIEDERVRQRALLQHLPDLVWLKDPDGVFLACNPRFQQLYGATEADICGRTDFDFVPRETAEAYRAMDRLAVERGGPSVNEEVLSFADGHHERVQTIKTPVHDASGRLLGVLGIARDITELRRAEDEYRWLFERNPAPMLVYERDTLALLRANEAFCRHYGWSEAELRGMSLPDLHPPEDHARLREHLPDKQGLVDAGEWRHLRRDGSLIQVLGQAHDTVHEGRAARVVAITDVTLLQQGRLRDRRRLDVMERLARGEATDSVLEQLARDHESLFPDSLCSVMLLDAGTQRLHVAAAPSLPAELRQAFDGLPVGPGVASCGAACHAAQRVVVADIENHPNWRPFVAAARLAGLRASWSEPIVGPGGRVLGSFSVYRRAPSVPTAAELEQMQFAVQLAATVLDHAGTARALRESENRLNAILHAMRDMVWLKDAEGVYRMCNAAFARMAGHSVEHIVGCTDADLTEPERAQRYRQQDLEVLTQGRSLTEERQMVLRHSGQAVTVELTKTPLFDERGRIGGVLGVARDVTEDRRMQLRVQRLNRTYALLGSVNEAVLRLREPAQLFAEICRIAVHAGGFRLAWIGQAGGTPLRLQPLAHHGEGAGFLRSVDIGLDEHSPGPASRAWRSGQPVVVPNVFEEPALEHRRAELREFSQCALLSLPIDVAGEPWRCLALYSDSHEHFDDEQLALLSRLAHDIEHALRFIAAERAQDEAQRFREQLIESVAGLFFAIDAQGRLVQWNRRFEELTGLSAAQLAQASATDFFAPADAPRIMAGIERTLAEGEARVEAEMLTRGGVCVPHVFVGRRVHTVDGALVVGTGIDISDRVRSEQELARYRDRLEHLVQQRTAELEAVNARLYREDRRLRAVLQLSQRASGLSEDEILQQGLRAVVELTGSLAGCVRSVGDDGRSLELRAWTGSHKPPSDAFAQQVLRHGRAHVDEVTPEPAEPGAEARPVQALGAPVFDAGRPAMVVCATHETGPYDEADQREIQLLAGDLWRIVQRRRIEIALGQAKSAADAASQAKSAFLANMSHEIRTPMNAIVGFAHLLKRDPLTPRQRDHLAKITDASQHLLQVINDILDFSKIEAHKITLEQADFTLRDGLARVLAMQADAARAKRLPVELHIDADVPAVLRGDRLRLEQILLNLLSNAVKFTSSGRIELRVSKAGPATQPPRLRIEVRDTGIGMTAEQLSRLFEAFAQADVSTTRRFGGTGLGLAISKRLVQLMDGQIGAHSEPGRGSTFWVELPLHEGHALAPPLDAAQVALQPGAARLQGARILVVEDNPVNQEVTATLLSALGARPQIASSGEEALRRFEAAAPDLVLMDVQMPGMDGLRTTAELRAAGRKLPIVAMTANAFPEDREQCLAAGMNDYLAKPVEPQALERCLLRWLPDRAPPSPAAADAELRQRLSAVEGLDMAGPLSRMRGAWPLYLRMLRMFAAHHGGDAERLQALADADLPGLRALVHSIGGAAATVGATAVLGQAQTLQARMAAAPEAAVSAADRRPLIDALRHCVQQLLAALDPPGAQAGPAGPPVPADRGAALALLDALAPLVAAHDTAALASFEGQRERWLALWGETARVLGEQLGQFDFSAAQQQMAALRQAAG